MNRRARIILGGLAAVYLVIVGRAFQVQVLGVEEIREQGARQYCTKFPLIPRRGAILDRTGSELAVSLSTKSIFVQPARLAAPDRAAAVLARQLGKPIGELRKTLSSDRPFLWIRRQMPSSEAEETVRKVREAMGAGGSGGDPGIGTVEEPRRFYPNRELASALLGFTDLDSVGLEGVELSLDKYLRGERKFILCERDARGRVIVPADSSIEMNSSGHSVSLTIDRNVQHVAQSELQEAVRKYRAKGGAAIVLRPRTGEVLALATLPAFNPNDPGSAPPETRRNRVITDTFEPGSTFKVFTLAAALELGAVRPGDRFDCEDGSYRFAGRTIHDTHRHDVLSVPEVIKFSSNIGAVKMSHRMDPGRFYDMIRAFGFGATTGVELFGEVGGLVPSRDRFSPIRRATVSFGQGIAVTPMQLAAAMGAVVNGGKMMKPYLVREIRDPEGKAIYRGQPRELRRVLSPKTSREVREILGKVVQEDGTGVQARVRGFLVGGKTGTAQKVEPGTGRYSPTKRVSSFVGFLPLEDPDLLILVVVDEPKGEVYGGVVAAPAFNQIAVKTAYYLGISPTEPVAEERAGPGNGKRVPEERPRVATVSLSRGTSPMVMPDLSGMSMGKVVDIMSRYSVTLRLEGTGVARDQSPDPGETLLPGTACTVSFGRE